MREIAIATNLVNIMLAVCVAGAALSIGSHITRETRCAIRIGIFGIMVGALAVVLGGIWEFGEWVQMVFSGGVLVYLLGNIRQPVAIPIAAWANRAAWAIAIVVVVALGAIFSGEAKARDEAIGKPIAIPSEDCQLIARVVFEFAYRRERGLPFEQHRAEMLKRQAAASDEIRLLFSRELEIVYKERRTPEDAALVAYKRCAGAPVRPRMIF